MRWVVWFLLIVCGAVGMALLMRFNHGNVAVFWPPYRVDLSVNFALVLLALGFIGLHLLLLGLSKALDLPARVRDYRYRRRRDGAILSLRDSLLAFFEGRFGRAERLAQSAREHPELAGAAALIAARAAHRMREMDRRDRWLASAEGDPLGGQAQRVTTAELAVDDQDPARALAAITALHGSGARHIHTLRLSLRAYEQNGDWARVLQVLRQLEKRDALHPAAVRGLKARAIRGLILQRQGDLNGLRELYGGLSEVDRGIPEIAEVAAEAFAQAGDEEQAWRMVEYAIRDRLSSGMLRLYTGLKSIPARERLMRAERWRERHGDDPALMLTLGRLCIDESLWGKAEEFLKLALRAVEPAPAHFALGELYEKVGRDEEAAAQYRQAAQRAFAHQAGGRRSTDLQAG